MSKGALMSKQEKLDEFLYDLPVGDVGVEFNDAGVLYEEAIKNLDKLINSEILAVLEELSQNKETLYWWTGGEYEKTTGVDMRAIQSIKEKYRG